MEREEADEALVLEFERLAMKEQLEKAKRDAEAAAAESAEAESKRAE